MNISNTSDTTATVEVTASYHKRPDLTVSQTLPVDWRAVLGPDPREVVDVRLSGISSEIVDDWLLPGAPMSLLGREGPKPSNLPVRNAAGDAIAAAEAATRAKVAAERKASGVALKKRWVKIGVQPSPNGFILHTEHYEGDTLLKTTVQRGLSPLAVREKTALHMAALYSVF